MGIVYTPEQQQVIDLHKRNILVSAAAGSGKTAVLTERIVKMISDEEHPVDIDRLLVVTFTNAAAAEMRERISLAITKRLTDNPENLHLQKQATLLHNAQITTIDSFCMFIIRNNFNDIGLDPGFRVADEGELKLLKQDMMKELLEEKYAQGSESFLECSEYFGTGSHDRILEEYILKLYQFAESCPWPGDWLEERKKDNDISSVEELEESSWLKFGMEQIRQTVEDCVRKIDSCTIICEQSDGPYMYGSTLENEKEKLERLLKVVQYQDGYALFQAVSFDRLPSKKDDSVSPVKREAVQAIRKEVKESIKTLCDSFFSASPETVVSYMKKSGAASAELVELASEFKKKLDEKKRERNIIDFSDMEHMALSILVKKSENGYEPSRTALDYRNHFEEILIDEYQDSNMLQEYILQSISGENDGRYNRFMVGDVKQSIYKFRLARPEIFMEKYNSYEKKSESMQRIDLHKNFRSRKEILDSVNFVFAQIMGKRLGGIEYDDEAALYQGADYPNSPGYGTELLLVQKEEEENSRQTQAYAAAKKIKELVGHFFVTDKETGELRKACYKDIVILLRTTSGWDEVFGKVLKEEGIPVHSASKTGYFAAKEIQTLLQFMRVLDNPLQDIALFGVLKSYFGGFNEEEIARMRTASKDRKEKLYFTVKEFASSSVGKDEDRIREKAQKFLVFLEDYRNKTIYMPIYELLQEIVIKTGYIQYVSALPGGEQRKANVEALLEKSLAFEKTSYYGLFHFIRYIEQLEKYDVDYGEANILDENADVVRIMSIHKSKGLEFPICFVCGLAKKFNMQDLSGKMILDVDMGIGVDYVDTNLRLQSRTLRKNIIARKLRLESLGEELRVLYVAMTRAKEKLIMMGVVDTKSNWTMQLIPAYMSKEQAVYFSDLAEAGSLLDLLLPAFARHFSFQKIWEDYGYDGKMKNAGCSLFASQADMCIQIVTKENIEESEKKEQIREVGARLSLELSDRQTDSDNELMTSMSNKFSYEYERRNLADLYTKTTVSELKMSENHSGQLEGKLTEPDEEIDFSFPLYEEEAIIPYIPRFKQTKESLGGAGRGSAFHKVMELIDFKECTLEGNGIKRYIEDLVCSKKLSQEYADAVSIPLIALFMESNLAKRMKHAAEHGMLYREQPFVLGVSAKRLNEKFPEEELVLIQGIIDVYFEEDGELVVVDYKTDRVNTPEELVDKYEKQLAYYEEALGQLTGKKVKEKLIYSFGLKREIVLL